MKDAAQNVEILLVEDNEDDVDLATQAEAT